MDPFGDLAVRGLACGLYARYNRIRNALAQDRALVGFRCLQGVKRSGYSFRPDDTLLFLPEQRRIATSTGNNNAEVERAGVSFQRFGFI